MAFHNNPRMVTDGLVLCLDASDINSYPGTGSIWYDISGSELNGTLYNITYSGGTMIFDGSTSYVNLGSFFNYYYFTISLWVMPGTTQTTYADIFDNWHSGTRNFVCQQNVSTTNQFEFAVMNTGQTSTTGTFNLTASIWTHLDFTWNNSYVVGYKNGISFATGSAISPINYSSQNLFLGNWNSDGRHWKGNMGRFSVFNRALSSLEILQNHNSQKSRFGL